MNFESLDGYSPGSKQAFDTQRSEMVIDGHQACLNALSTQSAATSTLCRRHNIPGPAARLYGVSDRSQGSSKSQRSTATSLKRYRAYAYDIATSRVWRELMSFEYSSKLDPNATLNKPEFSLTKLLKFEAAHMAKIPLVLCIVISILNNDGDAVVRVADPTGTMLACVEQSILEENVSVFSVGCGLVLRNCAVFSPIPGSRYLNILAKNVQKIVVESPDNT